MALPCTVRLPRPHPAAAALVAGFARSRELNDSKSYFSSVLDARESSIDSLKQLLEAQQHAAKVSCHGSLLCLCRDAGRLFCCFLGIKRPRAGSWETRRKLRKYAQTRPLGRNSLSLSWLLYLRGFKDLAQNREGAHLHDLHLDGSNFHLWLFSVSSWRPQGNRHWGQSHEKWALCLCLCIRA